MDSRSKFFTRSIRAVAAFGMAFACTVSQAKAAVVLESAVGGVYTYGIALGAGQQMFFNIGDRLTFTGLTGVTGASVGGLDLSGSFTTCGVTATSVCFGAASLIDLDNITNGTVTFNDLVIDSTSTSIGSVLYSYSNGNSGGEVGGPVGSSSSTPEPGTLPLLAAGAILSLFSFIKFGKSKHSVPESSTSSI